MVLLLNFDYMFTGIIETTGIVQEISQSGTNKSFWIKSSLWEDLKIDQSLAHSGVCLTIEAIKNGSHQVTAVLETLQKTNINNWKSGDCVNLERCLLLSSRLDGHFVQGHTDATGTIINKTDLNGSWQFDISFPPAFAPLLIEKGSITVNGISLTAFNAGIKSFSVAIIPYTLAHTNLQYADAGDAVNLEFDMMGKYIQRSLALKEPGQMHG